MHVRGVFRLAGAVLMVAGLLILVYSAYTYVEASLAEREAEAHIPGQVAGAAPSAPTGLPTLLQSSGRSTHDASAPSRTPPTDAPATATPTNIPLPADAAQSTGPGASTRSTEVLRLPATVQPTAPRLATNQAVGMPVGPQGLARGSGANPTRLIIPRLKLDTRVDEATWAVVNENGTDAPEWQIPFDAVGHLSTTAKPGEAGNAVISGHHNLIGPDLFGLGKFAGLWNLLNGDPVFIYDRVGRILQYRVAASYFLKEAGEPLSVREQHAQQILKDDGTPIVTFETCWNGAQAPLSGNTYRWIVVANLVGSVDPSQIPNIGNYNTADSGTRIAK